jgi:catechol 2,3-dioxygenase-like lactoylglutathione lyase family enzyme
MIQPVGSAGARGASSTCVRARRLPASLEGHGTRARRLHRPRSRKVGAFLQPHFRSPSISGARSSAALLGSAPGTLPSARAGPRIDHICALVDNYRVEEMRQELAAAGVKLTGQAAFGLVTDPEGLRLQLIGTPAGLAKTIIPATRVTQDDAAVQAIGLDHMMLTVSDLEKSAVFYRRLFGTEVSRSKNPGRVWFAAARTRLGLEAAGAGATPRVDHSSVRVAGFDRGVVAEKLKKLGVAIAASTDKKLLRFRDNDGVVVELTGSV